MTALIQRIIQGARLATANSGIIYVELDPILASADYEPETPFRAIFVEVAGDVTIKGIDGKAVTFPLTAGHWDYGGTAIVESTTTATGLIAIH